MLQNAFHDQELKPFLSKDHSTLISSACYFKKTFPLCCFTTTYQQLGLSSVKSGPTEKCFCSGRKEERTIYDVPLRCTYTNKLKQCDPTIFDDLIMYMKVTPLAAQQNYDE